MKISVRTLSLLLFFLVTPALAGNTSFCLPGAEFSSTLKAEYDEDVVYFGIENDGRLIQVYRSPTQTWTIVETKPGGESCYLASGTGWVQITREHGQPI